MKTIEFISERGERIRQKTMADNLFCIKDYGHTSNYHVNLVKLYKRGLVLEYRGHSASNSINANPKTASLTREEMLSEDLIIAYEAIRIV